MVVEDVEASVMGELLRFAYTDQCRRGTPEEVAKLMVAAEKYDVRYPLLLCCNFVVNISSC